MRVYCYRDIVRAYDNSMNQSHAVPANTAVVHHGTACGKAREAPALPAPVACPESFATRLRNLTSRSSLLQSPLTLPYASDHRASDRTTMICRQALRRQAQGALRSHQPVQRRGLAAPASGSFTYETGDASGIKVASRDIPGPVASVQLVAKAGTRFEPVPGLSEGLERFAFKVRRVFDGDTAALLTCDLLLVGHSTQIDTTNTTRV